MITSNDAYNERKRKWFKTFILYLGVGKLNDILMVDHGSWLSRKLDKISLLP